MRLSLLVSVNAFAAHAVALPQGRSDGENGKGNSLSKDEASKRANAVKDAFKTAWDGYYQYVALVIEPGQRVCADKANRYAFPNDELTPVNNSFSNSR